MGEHPTQQFARAWAHCPPSQGNTQVRRFQWRGAGGASGRAGPGHTWGIRVSPATQAEGIAAFHSGWSPSLLTLPGAAPGGHSAGAGDRGEASSTVRPCSPCSPGRALLPGGVPSRWARRVGGCGGTFRPLSASLSLPPTPGGALGAVPAGLSGRGGAGSPQSCGEEQMIFQNK